ncbi:MAG: hypothetical protein R3B99_22280 [Polyangiales bacterium]
MGSRFTWLLLLLGVGCSDAPMDALGLTPEGDGPRIVWNLNHEPLPELPLPNDVATWPDPTSPTGRRINVSLVAPTDFEVLTRTLFGELDGWGTYGGITIPFEEHVDTRDLFERQGGGSAAFSTAKFAEHAIYLVDLETGLPMPLDVNGGSFHYVLDNPEQYWRNDPRAGASNALFETVNEDVNGNGVLDPGEDTDFDGTLDQPSTFDGTADEPLDTVDEMTWFYERETKTLVLRPTLPLRPRHTYAVVLTDRLRGANGQSVRSPFEAAHPLSQRDALEPLADRLAQHPELYGDLATRGWDGISFAWTFTTQSTTQDLDALRAGLYGDGPFSWLAADFPPDYALAPMQGGRRCEPEPGQMYIAPGDRFIDALEGVAGLALGLTEEQTARVIESYGNLSHVVVMYFESPFLLGDPKTTDLPDTWRVDADRGRAEVSREAMSMILFVPKEGVQPHPVAFYVHGYGSASAEPLPFAGYMLQHGVATAMLNAEGHGVPLDDGLLNIVGSLFDSNCLTPTADAILDGRAEDIDGDGTVDSGVNFWTAYVFHTRDVVRQSVLDHMRVIQILRSFDGRRLANPVEYAEGPRDEPLAYDADTHAYEGLDVAGDFDGDGRPDVGGRDQTFFFTGGSLGGIVSGIVGGAEPAVRSVAPIVGAGGLTDVAARIDMGSVIAAMHLRMMGPFVMVEPADSRGDRSSCADGEASVYVLATDRNERGEMEIACLPADAVGSEVVIRVRNETNGEVRCAGATAGEAMRFRVPIPSDPDDRWTIELHAGAADAVTYPECPELGSPSRVIDAFEVGSTACDRCAQFQDREWSVGDALVSPAMGFGRQRQTPDFRRLLSLAQTGLEPGDPINYARRVFLEPIPANDAPQRPRSLLMANSVGDQSVPVSTGNAYARAAGLLAFVPPDGPDHLVEWRAPMDFEARYPGLVTPHDLLNAYHVLEGVDRLERHPGEGRPPFFLYDVDDVSEGRLRFQEDGRHQTMDPTAPQAPRLARPLRWVRRSVPRGELGDAVWSPVPGEDVSGLLNNYAIPRGVHGFDEIIYGDVPWDTSQYLINLVARWGATRGQDLRYHTDPGGHTCLEDSSCAFLER